MHVGTRNHNLQPAEAHPGIITE